MSLAPPGDALTILHSIGHGLSMVRSRFAIDASDTVNPSVTRSAAARRFSGSDEVQRAHLVVRSPSDPSWRDPSNQASYCSWETTCPLPGLLSEGGRPAEADQEERHQESPDHRR